MEIQKCTKANFDFILMNLNDYWKVKEDEQERFNTQGCKYLKAITQSKNATSIAFHQSFGMQLLGEPNEEGIRVVKNYAGPFAGDRVVFHKSIQ